MAAAAAARSKAHKHAQVRPAQAGRFWPLTLGGVGVVFAVIGTSPIYAFREAAIAATGEAQVTPATVLGILSLILWSLLLLVTVKYAFALLRADYNGEGGAFALMALAQSVAGRHRYPILLLGVVGACFLYGDAMIRPALSVLSAVEGLAVIAPTFARLVVPLSIAILVALFAVQGRISASVGVFFGPLVLLWFAVLGLVGASHVATHPEALAAFNPAYGTAFLLGNGLIGFTVLGFVFIAVTGAEILYADLGRFGRTPIQAAWLGVALPALALNYLGQGALVLGNPVALANPFLLMFPDWARWPALLLTVAVATVAGRTVITGAYSIARQAIQLGLLPRFHVRHLSEDMAGQIHLPRVNGLLLAAVLLLLAIFKSSSGLAAAYGLAVTVSMIVASLLAFIVLRRRWMWSAWQVAALLVPLLLVELLFLGANAIKLLTGAWVPIACAALLVTVMLTWRRGTAILLAEDRSHADLRSVIGGLERKPPLRVSGTAVFFTATQDAAPSALLHNLKHNRMLHERNIFLTVRTADTPRVPNSERVKIEVLSEEFTAVTLTYGFMETPDVMKGLQLCRHRGLNIDPPATSFFLSRRILRVASRPKMGRAQEKLFIWLFGSAEKATSYFQIPSDRVVELGTQVVV